ncbi:MAG: ARMT1-like domain-containing protein [Candidatus Poribacteria bacterium]|nr:ARMT1-like domain-containing protein [Candidatus Poribacteria bacterium]
MKSDAHVSKVRLPEDIKSILENILGCELEDVTEGMDFNPDSLQPLFTSLPTDSLENYLSPQWVVLAAGKGTRIDPTGRFSKTLDIMFGEQNMLQRSCRFLPGNRPHIVVINPQMANRIEKSGSSEQRLSANTMACIQEEMNGTGGALQAALPILRDSDAEWIGIAFGDEPFLENAIFAQTLLSHFLSDADVTLCGKIPETVVDKGGLFFDGDGKFIGTKEWYDMTELEKAEMWQRLERGEAYTNTGITIIRKSTLLERIDRLQPHTNRNGELHHVDLIRLCYEDGLKTNAFIYHGDVLSGVNRWSNVLSGETTMFKQTREFLANKGIRVDPSAQITLDNEDIEIGVACYLLGKIHIGKGVKIGDYCRLENVTLRGATSVGDSVGLQNVTAKDTTFESNQLPTTLAEPVRGLATISTIRNSTFDTVTVGSSVQLSDIQVHATVIPSDIRLENQTLGVPLTESPLGVPSPLFNQIVPVDYRPGVFTFGEKKDLPDWENLRKHVSSHSATELIPRATRNTQLQQVVCNAVDTLLDMRRANGDYLIESLTPEEVWGTIFEMVKLHTGNPNPYHRDKLKARQTALELLPEFWNDNWLTRLKLVVAGNVIDYSSARVVQKVNANPNYFSEALRAAVETPFAIDCYELFQKKVIDASPQRILWLADNDGEIIFDIALIQDLIQCGHQICIVGKVDNASNDVTLADLHEITSYPQFQGIQRAMQDGVVTLMSSGAKTIGTNLYNATPEFINALLDADLIISKGQGNFFTTPGWYKDTFYLLMSKGLTAERSTGVVADKNLPVDGLILGYLPSGTKRVAPLYDLCNL